MHLGEQTRAVHDREEKNVAKGIVHYVKNSTEHLFIPLASSRLKDISIVCLQMLGWTILDGGLEITSSFKLLEVDSYTRRAMKT